MVYDDWINSGDFKLLYPVGVTERWKPFFHRIINPTTQTVREIGCGVGDLTEALAEKYQVYVTENSEAARTHTQARVPSAQFDMQEAFAVQPTTDTILVVGSVLSLWEPDRQQEFLHLMNKSLAPGGQLILSWYEGIKYSTPQRLPDGSLFSVYREPGQAIYTYIRQGKTCTYELPWYPIKWETLKNQLIAAKFAAFKRYEFGIYYQDIVSATKCF